LKALIKMSKKIIDFLLLETSSKIVFPPCDTPELYVDKTVTLLRKKLIDRGADCKIEDNTVFFTGNPMHLFPSLYTLLNGEVQIHIRDKNLVLYYWVSSYLPIFLLILLVGSVIFYGLTPWIIVLTILFVPNTIFVLEAKKGFHSFLESLWKEILPT
jgi:hypothetical protein